VTEQLPTAINTSDSAGWGNRLGVSRLLRRRSISRGIRRYGRTVWSTPGPRFSGTILSWRLGASVRFGCAPELHRGIRSSISVTATADGQLFSLLVFFILDGPTGGVIRSGDRVRGVTISCRRSLRPGKTSTPVDWTWNGARVLLGPQPSTTAGILHQLGRDYSQPRTHGCCRSALSSTRSRRDVAYPAGLTAAGSAYCWGAKLSGQLGNPDQ
jgi:hypothetical protein